MALRISGLPLAELALAAGIVALGIPIASGAFHRLHFDDLLKSTVAAVDRGGPAETLVAGLSNAAPQTQAERKDLALALLTLADVPSISEPTRQMLLARARDQLRDYVSAVPGDGAAWASLAAAEFARGEAERAQRALKTSILVTPWSPSLVAWRCGLGIDLFAALDGEGRELMKGQFRLQAVRAVTALVDTAIQRRGVRIARILLTSSPDQLIAFETELAKRR